MEVGEIIQRFYSGDTIISYEEVIAVTSSGYETEEVFGSITYRKWWRDGKLHNLDGPAMIVIENGDTREYYYINGWNVNIHNFKEISKKLKENKMLDWGIEGYRWK